MLKPPEGGLKSSFIHRFKEERKLVLPPGVLQNDKTLEISDGYGAFNVAFGGLL